MLDRTLNISKINEIPVSIEEFLSCNELFEKIKYSIGKVEVYIDREDLTFRFVGEILSSFEEEMSEKLYDSYNLPNGTNLVDKYPPKSTIFTLQLNNSGLIEFRGYLTKKYSDEGTRIIKDSLPNAILLTREDFAQLLVELAMVQSVKEMVPEILDKPIFVPEES